MKFGIDYTQPSTVRNTIWVLFGLLGTIAYFFGKDPMPLMLMAGLIAGGLGVTIKD